MLILRQSRPILLSDKITIKTKVEIPWLEMKAHSWKLLKEDFELKLINSKLLSRPNENADVQNKCLILEIEVIPMQIIQRCNLTH